MKDNHQEDHTEVLPRSVAASLTDKEQVPPNIQDLTTGNAIPDGGPLPGIDLEALKISTDVSGFEAEEPEQQSVAIRKPHGNEYFYVHPDKGVWGISFLTVMDGQKNVYIVHPRIQSEIASDIRHSVLVPCLTRTGTVFLWPIPVPRNPGARSFGTGDTLSQVTKHAGQWIRVQWNSGAFRYVVTVAKAQQSGSFPMEVSDTLKEGMEGRVIDTTDHPVVKFLNGDSIDFA
jgi:hypothetical protein